MVGAWGFRVWVLGSGFRVYRLGLRVWAMFGGGLFTRWFRVYRLTLQRMVEFFGGCREFRVSGYGTDWTAYGHFS